MNKKNCVIDIYMQSSTFEQILGTMFENKKTSVFKKMFLPDFSKIEELKQVFSIFYTAATFEL